MTITIARWTLTDYQQMIKSGFLQDRHVELLEGLIVEIAPKGPEHAHSLTLLDRLLDKAAKGRYQVREAKPISLPITNSQLEPDIALVREKSYRQGHPAPTENSILFQEVD
ncbi:MAG: Uma2 family endonuclease [Cyanobacteria bacterium J06641_5]